MLENFCEVFAENANILVDKLSQLSADEKVINIYPLVGKTALDIICGKKKQILFYCRFSTELNAIKLETAMGIKVHAQQQTEANEYVEAISM